ncbi:MAG: exodeoxyribonuclease V subunit gamma [Deltaproteobacteria bacterium]|nr:exodeoxyribonuclease V subunit gamma [Deltaproteobacteria bacterium]MBW2418180.1 exodeoxyribonuclease V subunit gamma [Deltaproteobacteria bacterium]
MIVHRSNRSEELLEILAEVVRQSAGEDPFASEPIVVPGPGMGRWLSMELSRRLGVWANPRFPFPRSFVDECLRKVLEPRAAEEEARRFAPETLTWSIAEHLPAHLAEKPFEPVRDYLGSDPRGVKLLQLAQRLARTYFDYISYRPQMILAWEQGSRIPGIDGQEWQALLWRGIAAQRGAAAEHFAGRAQAFREVVKRAGEGGLETAGLPRRVSIFGVSTLPPQLVEVLNALSPWLEAHLFVLSPSREYWAEIRTRSARLRAARQEIDLDALHIEEGNSLLASLGRLGRDFQLVLERAGDYEESDRDLYCEPPPGPMLATLQGDMLALRDRRAGGDVEPLPLAEGDRSLRVHACHGPMREVQVLHEELLSLFEADPSLDPRDVVVMTPDVDAYAPFVQAVFATARAAGDEGGRPLIPHRIADRGLRSIHAVVDAFEKILDLLGSRMTATEVLDLLGLDCVRERFDIGEREVERLRGWIADSGIRWAIDAEHRRSFEQPSYGENTWRFGLDRMLLGYALADADDLLFAGVRPFEGIEGADAELLGRFAELCEQLFARREALEGPRTPARWREGLGELLESLVARNDDNAHEHDQIRRVLDDLVGSVETAGFVGEVGREAMREQIDERLAQATPAHGFLSGGVTFCELVPMRAIPFRVLCLMGMNDGAFPRVQQRLGFDLMAHAPRVGDRTPRDDDRYLFLEALLSVREQLVITYQGQSIRDGSPIPPSVVVSELLDVLGDSFIAERREGEDAAAALRRAVVVQHPLQPFSPRYFDSEGDPGLRSYSELHFEGARRLLEQRGVLRPFLTAPWQMEGTMEAEPGVIELDDLVRFFEHPVKSFLRECFGLRLEEEDGEVEDREPFELADLGRFTLGSELLERSLAGEPLAEAYDSIRAAGALPLGRFSDIEFRDLSTRVELVAQRVCGLRDGGSESQVEIDCDVGGERVTGTIGDLWPKGRIAYRYAKLGGPREIGHWIRHLVLSLQVQRGATAAEPGAAAPRSYLVGLAGKDEPPKCAVFEPVAAPEPLLEELLRIYRLGGSAPLLLFPRSSRRYVDDYVSAKKEEEREQRAAAGAEKVYQGVRELRPEARDPYIAQVFAGLEPLSGDFTPYAGGRFEELAQAVFGPLVEHREELP